MNRAELFEQIRRKQSYLCVGLDPDVQRMPAGMQSPEHIVDFLTQVVQATHPYCVAYKPNLAFFEAYGPEGWDMLAEVLKAIPEDQLVIADAKRGDIGNTSRMYAQAFFDRLGCDAVTVAPYMGEDSVTPFLQEGKWVVMLALTSNPGSMDFQMETLADGTPLYQRVVSQATQWATPDQLMLVVGATRTDHIAHLRALAPDYFFLVPGVGAQGGDLAEVSAQGFNTHCGLLVNASRSILYAGQGADFAEAAGREAKQLQAQMQALLEQHLPD